MVLGCSEYMRKKSIIKPVHRVNKNQEIEVELKMNIASHHRGRNDNGTCKEKQSFDIQCLLI